MRVDEGEFRAFVVAQAPALRRTAYVLCGDWHHAEDLVQSALVKLYVSWPRIRDRSALHAYVRRILIRVFVDEGRRSWRREDPTAELSDVSAATESAVDDRLALVQALNRLPPRQRACIVLRYWEDFTVEATAEAVGCRPGTVKSQSSRGLDTLRRLLNQEADVIATHEGRIR